MQTLLLQGTQVTDAGLKELKEIKRLKSLSVNGTRRLRLRGLRNSKKHCPTAEFQQTSGRTGALSRRQLMDGILLAWFQGSPPMSSRGLLIASCLLASLTAITASAQPPKPKDGPLGMKFVPLPKGATFFMGWDSNPKGVKTEIKEDFEIAVHTVTQEQWQAVMGNNPSGFSRDGGGKDKVKDIPDADLKLFPVEQVSWNDAQEFIRS